MKVVKKLLRKVQRNPIPSRVHNVATFHPKGLGKSCCSIELGVNIRIRLVIPTSISNLIPIAPKKGPTSRVIAGTIGIKFVPAYDPSTGGVMNGRENIFQRLDRFGSQPCCIANTASPKNIFPKTKIPKKTFVICHAMNLGQDNLNLSKLSSLK